MNPKIAAAIFLCIVAAGSAAFLALRKGGADSSRNRNGGRGRDRGRKNGDDAPPRPADGEVEIYVGNLSFDMTEQQLRSEFAKFGVVSDCRIVTNRSTGRSKGFGFVSMPHRKEAEIAIKALDDSEVMGRKMRVNEARGNNR